jgi:hypothetical protein
MEGYARVRRPERFPSLSRTQLLMIDGPFTELKGDGSDSLTLVPPSMIGPPEFIHINQQETTIPAISSFDVGEGRVTWIPWDAAGLYLRHSLPAHAGLLRDALDSLMPRRQIQTNAHPLTEMSLMRQQGRTLLHLINTSGHFESAYHAPLPQHDLGIAVEGSYRVAQLAGSGAVLKTTFRDGYTHVAVPELRQYELIVFQ